VVGLGLQLREKLRLQRILNVHRGDDTGALRLQV
jgi:hypothetical protein